ncbi:unnamed protein product [Euphydryas editha]|uniref:MHC class II antigen beta chain n=1 Tax=Euphydryas editha TaxID=104508 RepID=A0AAU9U0M6_EUPED|nr:unnamed protein product [Euphydryas editha]
MCCSRGRKAESNLEENVFFNCTRRVAVYEWNNETCGVHKDFFGRIVPLSQVQKQDAVSDVISSSSVFYQYREGFNNAVRRNVRMRDLL